jgi:hypothetical protein
MMLQALRPHGLLKVPPGRYHDFPINTAGALSLRCNGAVRAIE